MIQPLSRLFPARRLRLSNRKSIWVRFRPRKRRLSARYSYIIPAVSRWRSNESPVPVPALPGPQALNSSRRARPGNWKSGSISKKSKPAAPASRSRLRPTIRRIRSLRCISILRLSVIASTPRNRSQKPPLRYRPWPIYYQRYDRISLVYLE